MHGTKSKEMPVFSIEAKGAPQTIKKKTYFEKWLSRHINNTTGTLDLPLPRRSWQNERGSLLIMRLYGVGCSQKISGNGKGEVISIGVVGIEESVLGNWYNLMGVTTTGLRIGEGNAAS